DYYCVTNYGSGSTRQYIF
nr:immunoglobulin light chain junction region [Macaca mulatta]